MAQHGIRIRRVWFRIKNFQKFLLIDDQSQSGGSKIDRLVCRHFTYIYSGLNFQRCIRKISTYCGCIRPCSALSRCHVGWGVLYANFDDDGGPKVTPRPSSVITLIAITSSIDRLWRRISKTAWPELPDVCIIQCGFIRDETVKEHRDSAQQENFDILQTN